MPPRRRKQCTGTARGDPQGVQKCSRAFKERPQASKIDPKHVSLNPLVLLGPRFLFAAPLVRFLPPSPPLAACPSGSARMRSPVHVGTHRLCPKWSSTCGPSRGARIASPRQFRHTPHTGPASEGAPPTALELSLAWRLRPCRHTPPTDRARERIPPRPQRGCVQAPATFPC